MTRLLRFPAPVSGRVDLRFPAPRVGRAAAVVIAAAALLGPVVALSSAAAASRPALQPALQPARQQPATEQPATEQIVVKLASPQVRAASVLDAASVRGLGPVAATVAPDDRYVYRVPVGDAGRFLASMRSNPQVAYASVAQAVHATAVPNDPCFTGCVSPTQAIVEDDPAHDGNVVEVDGTVAQTNLELIHAPAAWAITTGSPAITVAVLDTGVDANHPDLEGHVVLGPTLCGDAPERGDTCAPGDQDLDGHGTHVTGIIAANTNNGLGIAGLGWNTRVEMFKVLDDQGNGTDIDVDDGVIDAVNSGARVINMSLAISCGGDQECAIDPDMVEAVQYALDHNVVVVAAAGNDGSSIPEFPASLPGVLAVAATDNTGRLAPFSEYGYAANIAAPGVQVLSTWNDGNYFLDDGTSMASPTVAASAALVLAANPALSAPQVGSLLEDTATAISGNPINGGLLNVGAAVQRAKVTAPDVGVDGYDLAGRDGSVYGFGLAPFVGSLAGQHLNKPIVGIAVKDGGLGYWMDASDGGVFSFGQAAFYGSRGGQPLNRPIVGMAATPDGRGYWLVASDGGIFSFGDAGFYGSTGSVVLNRPIVGMAATPDGRGYWLVASDGGIFTFGDAGFYGSTGSEVLNRPIVGMAATPDGRGYWLVASDGGIFSFGDAGFYGSTGSVVLNRPIVGMAATPDGAWLLVGGVGWRDLQLRGRPLPGVGGGAALPAPIVGAGN